VSEKAEEGDVHPEGLSEVVADKGYHSDRVLLDLEGRAVRSYLSEPDRGRRNWNDDIDAQQAVYANRRRIRGERGKRLHRMRGELIERPFAHLYETGGMRRTHLRGHTNILKRLLIHAAGFNLGLVMRTVFGAGTPRGLQGTLQALLGLLLGFTNVVRELLDEFAVRIRPYPVRQPTLERVAATTPRMVFATGC
jgi:transposase